MRHECAVAGCGRSIVAGTLMCRPHWFMASAETRAAVNHCWNALQMVPAGQIRYLRLLRDYRHARGTAIAEVDELLRHQSSRQEATDES